MQYFRLYTIYIIEQDNMKSRDELLVQQLLKGDRRAQRELYDRYSSSLLAIAVRYLGDRVAAEDLLHDAFIKIFGSIGRFKYRGEGSLRAWTSRIVVNMSLEQLRHNSRHLAISLDSLPLGQQEAEAEYPEVGAVPYEVLLGFVAELPDGYRTVFNLFCVEGYSHREIARELGINEKSSSSQLLRAKRLLASKIKSYIELHE